ncbi:MAG: urease accessory protein UreD [Candidatus Hydrogenedentota bacterium]|nr:MAG: urease accessory protein UreD [Candidatus Hydrogenedentota bacterium]
MSLAERPQVDLRWSRDAEGRTFVSHRFVSYPFAFTKPFHLDDEPKGMLTVIMQSTSGGVFANERLGLSLTVEPKAEVHFTTQSATVVHAMKRGEDAHQEITLSAAKDTFVEYMPETVILFPGAQFFQHLNVVVDPSATVMFCESFLNHDPQREREHFALLDSEITVTRPYGEVVCRDRLRTSGRVLTEAVAGIAESYLSHGLFAVVRPADEEENTRLQDFIADRLDSIPNLYAGVSTLPADAGVCVRLAAIDGNVFGIGLMTTWALVREYLTGVTPPSRRKQRQDSAEWRVRPRAEPLSP